MPVVTHSTCRVTPSAAASARRARSGNPGGSCVLLANGSALAWGAQRQHAAIADDVEGAATAADHGEAGGRAHLRARSLIAEAPLIVSQATDVRDEGAQLRLAERPAVGGIALPCRPDAVEQVLVRPVRARQLGPAAGDTAAALMTEATGGAEELLAAAHVVGAGDGGALCP